LDNKRLVNGWDTWAIGGDLSGQSDKIPAG
jgi:hypothetical protein